MNRSVNKLGLGIGWRPQIALAIERRRDVGFVEVVAENVDLRHVPAPLQILRDRGVQMIAHGISLSLGGAEPVDVKRVKHMADVATRLGCPIVSEHIAFVRGGGMEAGHLLPIPRTRSSLRVLVENVRMVKNHLPVPLALENISALFEWPDAELNEADFVAEALEQTDSLMLLDIANVFANAHNLGGNPIDYLRQLPLHRLAYVHVGGGEMRDGVYHDTHAHPVPPQALELLATLCEMIDPPGVMLERDDHFPPEAHLNAELDAITTAMKAGRIRKSAHV
jgi:uncharacterized protein